MGPSERPSVLKLQTPEVMSRMTNFNQSSIYVLLSLNGANPIKLLPTGESWSVKISNVRLGESNTFKVLWYEIYNGQTLLLSEQVGQFFGNAETMQSEAIAIHVWSGSTTEQLSFDADQDGIFNLEERINGTNPFVSETGILTENQWAICWHGRTGHEFLVAYPMNRLSAGLRIADLALGSPWAGAIDISNDSLKMCQVNDVWYGRSDPNPWFPMVSYIQYQTASFLVCEHSTTTNPVCLGDQWNLVAEGAMPDSYVLEIYSEPVGADIQLLGFTPTQ